MRPHLATKPSAPSPVSVHRTNFARYEVHQNGAVIGVIWELGGDYGAPWFMVEGSVGRSFDTIERATIAIQRAHLRLVAEVA